MNKENRIPSRGQLKVSIEASSKLLHLYVQDARSLVSKWKKHCNAYVQLQLCPDTESCSSRKNTDVIYKSNSPCFNQHISYDLQPEDIKKRLLISTWHKDEDKMCSEFVGCMSFGIRHLIQKSEKKRIEGYYHLLSETVGHHKHIKVDDEPPSQENIPRQPSPGQHKKEKLTLLLHRQEDGFGFTVRGPNPVRVGRVKENSAAHIGGLIHGDHLIKLNGDDVTKSKAADIALKIKNMGNVLVLDIERPRKQRGWMGSYMKPASPSQNHIYESIEQVKTCNTIASEKLFPDSSMEYNNLPQKSNSINALPANIVEHGMPNNILKERMNCNPLTGNKFTDTCRKNMLSWHDAMNSQKCSSSSNTKCISKTSLWNPDLSRISLCSELSINPKQDLPTLNGICEVSSKFDDELTNCHNNRQCGAFSNSHSSDSKSHLSSSNITNISDNLYSSKQKYHSAHENAFMMSRLSACEEVKEHGKFVQSQLSNSSNDQQNSSNKHCNLWLAENERYFMKPDGDETVAHQTSFDSSRYTASQYAPVSSINGLDPDSSVPKIHTSFASQYEQTMSEIENGLVDATEIGHFHKGSGQFHNGSLHQYSRKSDAILEQEEKYLKTLQDGIQTYSMPLRHCVLSSSQNQTLFQNIEKIAAISRFLIQQIQENPQSLIQVYTERVNMLINAYKSYTTGLPAALKLLDSLRDFSEFVHFMQSIHADGMDITIDEFISLPVKHLEKLYINLDKLLQTTPSDLPSFKNLRHLVKELEAVYVLINPCKSSRSCRSSASTDRKRAKTRMFDGSSISSVCSSVKSVDSQVMNIEDRLVFNHDVQRVKLSSDPLRHVIYSSELISVEDSECTQIWVILLSDLILVTTEESNGALVVKENPIYIRDIVNCDWDTSHPSEFVINSRENNTASRSRRHVFKASNMENKCAWKSILEQRIRGIQTEMNISDAIY